MYHRVGTESAIVFPAHAGMNRSTFATCIAPIGRVFPAHAGMNRATTR